MHGWRARIGLLVPAINTIMEPEMWRTAPPHVTIHSARIAGGREGTPDELQSMEVESQHACARVAMTEPHAIVYACTSGSFFEGRQWNERIGAKLTEIAGVPAITTAGAMAAALTARKVRRVAVVTPYVELTNARLTAFLAEHQIEVTRLGTFDMLDMFDHAKIQPHDVYEQVKKTITGDEDAVFIACTQVRALEVVELLERDLNIPVMSAVQATIWQTYRTLGIDP
ncbi:MAG: aspartate/glutamate racemase family protein, partial [Gammaproteobacteria bacterium]|nr:aspartate/glutamate racemase family protein [Gammaproteobacteria bacterium]